MTQLVMQDIADNPRFEGCQSEDVKLEVACRLPRRILPTPGLGEEFSFRLLDAFFDAGGNFIDTANNYQDQSSEEFIGEWAEKRGIRNELVIVTKYTSNYVSRDGKTTQRVLFSGNNYKLTAISVEASLPKLRKVLYLGVSDTPAWVVSKTNQYARDHGLSEFIICQGARNVMPRDFEREIIPMARQERTALAPWNVINGGKLRSDEEEEKRRQTGEGGRTIASGG
ncbi:Aldo keto reductase [Coniophora puteana RWD-64-598 SS2]|uniref:Aldo keto reductase n=1 Tax=Coniophora puteana (strain RWD-64-598) TaxID=741705 RepID=A0A5M3MX73_CONPW|nr:Aldo keto reductase [Coniophora puteana RWD-64-598 SS2]EIW83749.1 Aldo keto reductase [Coniophora puteana RWD-64-598 SS2]